jgi:hypothetical protein
MTGRASKLEAIASMPITSLQNIGKGQAESCAKAGVTIINDLLNHHTIDEFTQLAGINALSAVDHIRKAEMACLESSFTDLDGAYAPLKSMTLTELSSSSEKELREISGASHHVAHQIKEDASTLVACLDQKFASELTLGVLVESRVFYDAFSENSIGDIWLVNENAMPGAVNAELAYTEDGLLVCPGGPRRSEREGTVIRMLNPMYVGADEGEYVIEARMLCSGNETEWGRYGVQAIVFRSQTTNPADLVRDCYKFQWSGNQADINTWSLERRVNGSWTHLVESKEHPLQYGHWYRMSVEANGPEIICKVDLEDGQGWQEIIRHNTQNDDVAFSNGTVGLFCCWNYEPQFQMVDYYEVRKIHN